MGRGVGVPRHVYVRWNVFLQRKKAKESFKSTYKRKVPWIRLRIPAWCRQRRPPPRVFPTTKQNLFRTLTKKKKLNQLRWNPHSGGFVIFATVCWVHAKIEKTRPKVTSNGNANYMQKICEHYVQWKLYCKQRVSQIQYFAVAIRAISIPLLQCYMYKW